MNTVPEKYIPSLTTLNAGLGNVTSSTPQGLAVHSSGTGYCAAVSGTNSTAAISWSAIDVSQPFHLAVLAQYDPTDNKAFAVQFRAVDGTTNQAYSGVTMTFGTDGYLGFNRGGASMYQKRTLVAGNKYVLYIIGDGSSVTYGCADYDSNVGNTGSGGTVGSSGTTGLQYQIGLATDVSYQGTGQQVNTWTSLGKVTIQTSSTSHRLLAFGFNRGGWGGFTNSAAKIGWALTRYKMTGAGAGDVDAKAVLPPDFSGSAVKHAMFFHWSTGATLQSPTYNAVYDLVRRGWFCTFQQGTSTASGYSDRLSSNWAGDDGIAYRLDRLNWVTSNFYVSRQIGVGISMGLLNALQVAHLRPSIFDGIVGISGVTDLLYAYNLPENYKSLIDVGQGTSTYAAVQDHDPKANITRYVDLPMLIRFGTADGTLHKTQHADEFVANLTTAGNTRVTQQDVSGANHLDTAMFDGVAVADWAESIGDTASSSSSSSSSPSSASSYSSSSFSSPSSASSHSSDSTESQSSQSSFSSVSSTSSSSPSSSSSISSASSSSGASLFPQTIAGDRYLAIAQFYAEAYEGQIALIEQFHAAVEELRCADDVAVTLALLGPLQDAASLAMAKLQDTSGLLPAVRSLQQHVRATSGLPVDEWIAEAIGGGKIPYAWALLSKQVGFDIDSVIDWTTESSSSST